MINQGDVLGWGAFQCSTGRFYSVSKKLAYSVLIPTDPWFLHLSPALETACRNGNSLEIKANVVSYHLHYGASCHSVPDGHGPELVGDRNLCTARSMLPPQHRSLFSHRPRWWGHDLLVHPLIQSPGLVGFAHQSLCRHDPGRKSAAWWLIGQWQATGMAIALLSTNLFSLAYFPWAQTGKFVHRSRSIPPTTMMIQYNRSTFLHHPTALAGSPSVISSPCIEVMLLHSAKKLLGNRFDERSRQALQIRSGNSFR